ncbi:MAG: transcription termination factor NusA [Bacteroidales bacterium]|nr:transcription termination factor NusA [Bacteroidales bacterium]
MLEREMTFFEVKSIIKDMLKSAYKRKFGTDENAEVKFFEKGERNKRYYVEMFAKKLVVEEENYYNEVTEIPLDEAVEVAGDEVEVGDELEISLNPKTFEYSAVQSAKQRGQQVSKEMTDDKTFIKAKSMEFSLIKGELKKIGKNNADWLVDIGFGDENLAVFPVRGQSPRQTSETGDTIRFYVEKVDRGDEIVTKDKAGKTKKKKRGVKISLSRSSKEFVKALLEAQLREEIENGTVVIKAMARQAGIRTKVAVDTKKSDVDPVGATVGKAGAKIITIMNEIEGEKIDVVRYNDDPIVFIANSLIPAQVQRVVEIDPQSKYAVAIVDDSQQGIAIGQGGVNVKLAKTLCDWIIDVKTKTQFNEMDQTQMIQEQVSSLFKPETESDFAPETVVEEPVALTNEQIGIAADETPIADIGLSASLVKKLHDADIWSIEEFFEYTDEELLERDITAEEIETVRGSVEVVTEEDVAEEFECPVCHAMVPAGSNVCPNCGTEFEFE